MLSEWYRFSESKSNTLPYNYNCVALYKSTVSKWFIIVTCAYIYIIIYNYIYKHTKSKKYMYIIFVRIDISRGNCRPISSPMFTFRVGHYVLSWMNGQSQVSRSVEQALMWTAKSTLDVCEHNPYQIDAWRKGPLHLNITSKLKRVTVVYRLINNGLEFWPVGINRMPKWLLTSIRTTHHCKWAGIWRHQNDTPL